MARSVLLRYEVFAYLYCDGCFVITECFGRYCHISEAPQYRRNYGDAVLLLFVELEQALRRFR